MLHRITVIQAITTAIKIFIAGEIFFNSFKIVFEMRFLFNKAYDMGFSPEELQQLLDH